MSTTTMAALLLLASSTPAQEHPLGAERLTRKNDRVYVGVNFSPDGKLLAVSGEPFISLLETGEFKSVKELKQRGLVDEAVFDPDMTLLISRSKAVDTVVWDASTWRELKLQVRRPPGTYETRPWLAAFGSAPVDNGPWNNSAQRLLYLAENPLGSCPAAFSGDGRWVALSNGRTGIRMWDLADLNPERAVVWEFSDYAEARLLHANALLFHPRYILLGEEGGFITPLALQKWEDAADVARGKKPIPTDGASTAPSVTQREHEGYQRHQGHVTSLCLSPEGQICISAAMDGKVRAWALDQLVAPRTSKPEWTVDGHYAELSKDGRHLAVAEEKGIRIYSFHRRAPVLWIPTEPRLGKTVRLRFNPSGDQLAGISCICEDCVPRKGDDVSLAAYKTRHKRVHHHGGTLQVWKLAEK